MKIIFCEIFRGLGTGHQVSGKKHKKDYKLECSEKILCSFNLQTGETFVSFNLATGMIKALSYQSHSKKN